jgi:allophanate hydrolase subunit 1
MNHYLYRLIDAFYSNVYRQNKSNTILYKMPVSSVSYMFLHCKRDNHTVKQYHYHNATTIIVRHTSNDYEVHFLGTLEDSITMKVQAIN